MRPSRSAALFLRGVGAMLAAALACCRSRAASFDAAPMPTTIITTTVRCWTRWRKASAASKPTCSSSTAHCWSGTIERTAARTGRSNVCISIRCVHERNEHGGRVFREGPTFTLLIDFKSAAEPTYSALCQTAAGVRTDAGRHGRRTAARGSGSNRDQRQPSRLGDRRRRVSDRNLPGGHRRSPARSGRTPPLVPGCR